MSLAARQPRPWLARRAFALCALLTLSTALSALAPAGRLVVLKAPAVSAKVSPDEQQARLEQIAALQEALLATLGKAGMPSQDVYRYRYLPLLALTLDAAQQKRIERLPFVASVQPDRLNRPSLDVSVPLVAAPALWLAGWRGAGTSIAILDSGVEAGHPFLAGRLQAEACFSRPDSAMPSGAESLCPGGAEQSTLPGSGAACSEPAAACAHGSHVAGIALGQGSPFSGVAPAAGLVAIQVFGRYSGIVCGGSGSCIRARDSDYIAALEHVYALRDSLPIVAVNLSLGGGRYAAPCPEHPAALAVELLRSADIASVIASGNNGYSDAINAPGCIPAAISVGASNDLDQLAGFSNLSPLVDLLAPGAVIRSSIPGAAFADFNGTSMAAPHVAGALALLRNAAPTASLDTLELALRDSGPWITDSRVGPGTRLHRLQIEQAQARLLDPDGPQLQVSLAAIEPFQGRESGPFAPAVANLQFSNSGNAAADWQLQSAADWIAISPAQGSLGAAATQSVQLTLLQAQAASLAPGRYSAVLRLDNLSNARGSRDLLLSLLVQHPQPGNDAFAAAEPLYGASVTLNADNRGAGAEPGEPAHVGQTATHSLWWRWQAAVDGEVALDTEGSDFDTVLAIYHGDQLSDLLPIAGNDDVELGVLRHSALRFRAAAGVEYRLAVDGFAGDSGVLGLRLQAPVAPAGLLFASSFEGPR